MDWIIWLIVIAVIVGVVWRLLSRNDARAGSGKAGTTTPATTAARDSTQPHPDEAGRGASDRGAALTDGEAAAPAAAAGMAGMAGAAEAGRAEHRPEPELEPEPVSDAAAAAPGTAAGAEPAPAVERADAAAAGDAGDAGEWETQWSETPPPEPHAPVHHEGAHSGNAAQGAHVMEGFLATGAAPAAEPAAAQSAAAAEPAASHPVHHPEYTEPHAPTLPGAESAAAEAEVVADTVPATAAATPPAAAPERPGAVEFSDAETAQTASSSAASETAAAHAAEPAGHLALDQPYGEGSAAPAADGSGPEGFTVKGNASSMIYHDETSPAYEETRAEVWFVSTAYAEAAGFRPPRRSRL